MGAQPSFEEQEVLADTRRRAVAAMTGRELLAELLVGIGFLAVVVALWLISPPHGLNPIAAILSVAVMALATRVSFDTPFGFTPATQLAFVPLLFAVPRAAVPIAVVVALVIAQLPDVLAGRLAPVKLWRTPANAWFSLGPALVFAIAGTRPDAAGAALLVAALAAQFLGDFGASGLYFGIARRASLRSQVGETWVYAIDAALSAVGLVVAEEISAAPYAVVAVVPLLGLLAMFAHERRGRLDNLLELNETYRGAALLLGDVIAADDGYTGEHSDGVVGLALGVADALGFDPGQRRNLEFGAMLHDVGKIAIPKEIINKPGKLDADEWAIIKTHPAVGERMLNRVGGFMREVGRIVRHHHERWDGGGYPDGLAGDAVPMASRIIACCDAWSAMRTDRAYRKAMSFQAAKEQMLSNAGSQFDPAIVAAILGVVSRSEAPAAAPDGPEFLPLEVQAERRAAAAVEAGRAPKGVLA
jgi:HD-GYP domain-containing protein (c-di-GMP phosphodiesterase class II)